MSTAQPVNPLKKLAVVLCITASCGYLSAVHAEDELRFDISGFQIDGNSVLSNDRVDSVLIPLLGKGRTLTDVLTAVQTLQDAYRDAGFAAVQVFLPEQDTAEGVIRVGVIEPKITAITLEAPDGASDSSPMPAAGRLNADTLQDILPPLRLQQTPDIRAIDDAVRLANQNPARRIQVGLEATGAGTDILARLKVEHSPPLRTFIKADNTGSIQTGRTRVSIGAQHADFAGLDHTLTAQYTTSPERIKETTSLSLGYRIPLYAQKSTLDLVAAYSDTQAATSSTTAGDLQFAGKGSIYSARLTRQLLTQGLWEHSANIGIDHKAFTNICSLGTFGAAGCGTAGASITTHPLSIGYAGKMAAEGLQIQATTSYTQNLPGGKLGTDTDFAAARAGAKARYGVWRGNVDLVSALPANWQGKAGLSLQHSRDALVSSEQFGLGGASSVRGYGERVQSNDSGWLLNLEAYSPGIGDWVGLPAEGLRTVFFHDVGATRRNQLQAGEFIKTRLASVGIGFRLAPSKQFQAQIDLGQALVTQPPVQTGDWRAHGTMVFSW